MTAAPFISAVWSDMLVIFGAGIALSVAVAVIWTLWPSRKSK